MLNQYWLHEEGFWVRRLSVVTEQSLCVAGALLDHNAAHLANKRLCNHHSLYSVVSAKQKTCIQGRHLFEQV